MPIALAQIRQPKESGIRIIVGVSPIRSFSCVRVSLFEYAMRRFRESAKKPSSRCAGHAVERSTKLTTAPYRRCAVCSPWWPSFARMLCGQQGRFRGPGRMSDFMQGPTRAVVLRRLRCLTWYVCRPEQVGKTTCYGFDVPVRSSCRSRKDSRPLALAHHRGRHRGTRRSHFRDHGVAVLLGLDGIADFNGLHPRAWMRCTTSTVAF